MPPKKEVHGAIPRHPIKVVSGRTGLTPEVLRVWEKRYGVVRPERTEGGQRLYSDQEIERLRLLRALTLEGRRIGEMSRLDTEELRALLIEDQDAERPPTPSPTHSSLAPDAADLKERALRAVEDLDQPGLRSALARTQVTLGAATMIEEVLSPLIHELGARWARGNLKIHQEHFATVEIRRLLDLVMDSAPVDGNDPRLVVSTPAGELHELGAMLVAGTAAAEGWRVTYLGPNLPAEEIAAAARSLGATAVALSVVFPQVAGLETEIRQLRSRLPRRIALFVGGAAFDAQPGLPATLGAERVENLDGFRAVLRRLASRSS